MRLSHALFIAVSFSLLAPLASAIAQINPDVGDDATGAKVLSRTLDPDAGDEAGVSPPRAVAAVVDPDCDLIGDYINTSSGANRYRGNVYHFNFDAVLNEIQMELAFSGTTDLHVAIHRKDANGVYQRYPPNTSDIIIPNAMGTGLPVFYSTANAVPPMPEVDLQAGYDYAIAFAWGSTVVTYGRDNQDYPLPFRAGQVLGLAAVSNLLPPPNPLVPDTLPRFTLSTIGAYSMQLCFKPEPGACCSQGAFAGRQECASADCCELLQTDCTDAGAFWHGEHTRCFETPCIFGACCTRCGECLEPYTEGGCFLAADGASHWSDVAACPAESTDLCPPIIGACCRGTACTVECREDCENLPDPLTAGTYLGDGTSCTPNRCQGACCVSGACLNRTRANCPLPQVFKGEGTTCLTLPPANQCGGACCRGFDISELDFCERVSRRSDCVFDPLGYPSAAYRGDNTTCPAIPSPCPVVPPELPRPCCNDRTYFACCLPDGTCVNMTSTQCSAGWIKGEFHSGRVCEDGAATELCIASLQRCCFTNGTCRLLTDTGCTALGGFPSAETTCPANVCAGSIPTGACCSTTAGVCTRLSEAECNTQGRLYRGDGTDCGTPDICPGFGACCRYDGDCFDGLTPTECEARGGEYGGDGSPCDPPGPPLPICDDERGACCAISGTCLLITQVQCEDPAIGGVFKGMGVPCLTGTCPAGACCLEDGCEKRTPANCRPAAEGDYQGDNVECVPGLCVVGACCNGIVCSRETRFICERLEFGVYKGDGTNCVGPNPCPCTDNMQCDDGNACTDNTCDPAAGCVYSPITCDDGNACINDNCDPATGCVHSPITCDDRNVCTDDSCDRDSGCVNTNNTNACADDGNPCTNDICNGNGACTHPPITPICDNGTCECGETCISCPQDCGCTSVLTWESVLTHSPNQPVPIALAIPDTGLFSEPRSGIKMIVVTFGGALNPATAIPANVTVCGNNDVTGAGISPVDLSGVVVTTATTTGDTKMEINFAPALPNFARYRIELKTTILGANGDPIQAGTGGLSRILTALQGDASGDRRVNATDVGGVRGLVGTNPIDPAILTHVRSDANNDGRINATDVGGVRGRVGNNAQSILDPICP